MSLISGLTRVAIVMVILIALQAMVKPSRAQLVGCTPIGGTPPVTVCNYATNNPAGMGDWANVPSLLAQLGVPPGQVLDPYNGDWSPYTTVYVNGQEMILAQVPTDINGIINLSDPDAGLVQPNGGRVVLFNIMQRLLDNAITGHTKQFLS